MKGPIHTPELARLHDEMSAAIEEYKSVARLIGEDAANKTPERRAMSEAMGDYWDTVVFGEVALNPINMNSSDQIQAVAREFSRELRATLTAEQIAQAVALNAAEPADSPVCHSADFCDSNMCMAAAIQRVCHVSEDDILNDPTDYLSNLWNAAWAVAEAGGFAT